MTISKVQIYNIALNILGITNPIENINIDDNKCVILNNYYDIAKEYVLKDFDWNFASVFKELNIYENQNFNSKYKFSYYYPNDCLCARDIFQKNSYRLENFEVASSLDNKKIIMTDVENAVLRYTKRVNSENQYSCEFSMALANYLAFLSASSLTGNFQKSQMANQSYLNVIKKAKFLNAQEGIQNIYKDETYIDSRY